MKFLRPAAAAMLALTLAGCSSPASSSPASATAQAKTVVAEDVRKTSLESTMEKLDAAGITYEVRIQGQEGTIMKDPSAAAEKGRWKTLTLMDDTKGAFSKDELKTGDSVQILVHPMVTPAATPTPTPTPLMRKITYVITADGPILNATFGNTMDGGMSTEQANDVASPFTKEYTFTQAQLERAGFSVFSVSAQAGEGTTTISCQINLDEVAGPVKTSTGPYAIVMCTR